MLANIILVILLVWISIQQFKVTIKDSEVDIPELFSDIPLSYRMPLFIAAAVLSYVATIVEIIAFVLLALDNPYAIGIIAGFTIVILELCGIIYFSYLLEGFYRDYKKNSEMNWEHISEVMTGTLNSFINKLFNCLELCGMLYFLIYYGLLTFNLI